MADVEYFGTDAQKAVMRRGRDLYEVVRGDRRLTYHGRVVGVASVDDAPLAMLAALTRLQGNSIMVRIPDTDFDRLAEDARSFRLTALHYRRWVADEAAFAAADVLRDARTLPEGLFVHRIGPDTSDAILRDFGDTAVTCGVVPPPKSVLLGKLRPGVGVAVCDGAGKVLACAGAAASYHAEHPLGQTECWWGMLCTHPKARGQGLSLVAGAEAMVRMRDEFGFQSAYTGIDPGNVTSEAVCKKMGLALDGLSILALIDETLLPEGRMTK